VLNYQVNLVLQVLLEQQIIIIVLEMDLMKKLSIKNSAGKGSYKDEFK